ncbi:MAG: vWA domain-containing protein [Actinomycetota bacterium]
MPTDDAGAPDRPRPDAGDALAGLIGFGRALRRRGLPVGTGRIVTFARAVAVLSPVGGDDLYWAARASLISRPEDVEAFDAAFADAFREGVTIELPLSSPGTPSAAETEATGEGGEALDGSVSTSWRSAEGDEADADGADTGVRVVASAAEALRDKSFADLSEDERLRVARMIRRLSVDVPVRRTRRSRPSSAGATFDMRRTLRRSLRTHGEPFDRAWRSRSTRARPLVLILDVSGSMTPYARALMQFGFAAMAAGRRVEVFCFGTHLTRVTRTLMRRDPDRALHDVGRVVPDWEGGTRIGASLKELLDGWSQRSALRGSVAVICSDGLERGDPELLAAQMRRLRRLAHRVVWVNPLKGSARYEPAARGMAAALPSVDVFLAGHNLESLEALGRAVAV